MWVRERPPLRLHHEVVAPSGRRYRWGPDERDAANVPSDTRFSDTMPGGFESSDQALPRKPGADYADLTRLSTLRVLGAGGEVAWEGRVERAPRTSGEKVAVSPSAVGWQAHLEDDRAAGPAIYVDRETSRWGEPPLWRRAYLGTNGNDQGAIQASASDKGLVWVVPNESLPDGSIAELWYEAPAGVQVEKVGYKAARAQSFSDLEGPALYATDSSTAPGTFDNNAVTYDDTVREVALSNARRRLMLRVISTGNVTPPAGTQQTFSKVAVYGTDVPTHDLDGETDGVRASDVVAHAIGEWAPQLRFTEGTAGTIRPSVFVLPHLAFFERTNVGEIVKGATRFGLQDWAVWEDRYFYWHERGARGRKWRARVGPAQLEETGPQVDRLWESIVVQYQDVDGTARTVGPPGSGADTETSDLKDSDPENPANQLGIPRRDMLQAGTLTTAGATELGRRWLEESRLLDTSGRAMLVGHVEDDRGVLHPAWKVRAGDQFSFADASDTSYRRVVKKDYSDSTKTCSVDLDSPPEGLAALQERLAVVLVPLGIG